jgi:hypothetical protein
VTVTGSLTAALAAELILSAGTISGNLVLQNTLAGASRCSLASPVRQLGSMLVQTVNAGFSGVRVVSWSLLAPCLQPGAGAITSALARLLRPRSDSVYIAVDTTAIGVTSDCALLGYLC